MSCVPWIENSLRDSHVRLRVGVPRAGQRLVVPNKTVCLVVFTLAKAGAPTGYAYARIRRVSDDSIIQTVGTLDVSTLSDVAYAEVAFSFKAEVDEEVYILLEYEGGDDENYVRMGYQNTDVIPGNYTYFYHAYVDVLTADCTIKIYETPYVPPPPPTYILSVNSTPITGIQVTTKKEETELPTYMTPATIELEEGTYLVTVPSNHPVGADIYNFVQWEDGSTDPTRTINLVANKTITATYELPAPPPPAKGNLQIHASLDGAEVPASYEITETGQTGTTPATIELNPGTYTVTATHEGESDTKTAEVVEGQTVRVDLQFVTPTPPETLFGRLWMAVEDFSKNLRLPVPPKPPEPPPLPME